MAEDILFSVGVDTGNTVQEMNKVDQSIEKTDESVKELNTDMQKATQSSDKWENELAQLNERIKNEPINIRKMNKQIQEYQAIALNAGRTSAVGQQALQKAAQLKDQYIDIQAETNRMANDHQKLKGVMEIGTATVAGYGAFKGAMTLAGVESESLQKTMVKLQAVQTTLNGINQIKIALEKESNAMLLINNARTKAAAVAQAAYAAVVGTTTGALKLFRIAMIATGIGAIVVGLVLLITNFKTVSKWVGTLTEKMGAFGKIMEWTLKVVFWPFILAFKAAKSALEALGIIESKEAKASSARHAKRMAQVEERLAKEKELRAQLKREHEKEQRNLERLIKLAQAQGKSTEELTKQKINGSIEFQKNQLKEIENNIRIIEIMAKTNTHLKKEFEEGLKAQKDFLQKTEDNIADAELELIVMEEESKKKRSDAAKKSSDEREAKAKAEAKKMLELQKLMTDLSIKNIEDARIRQIAALGVTQEREREMLRAKFGENTELEKELIVKQRNETIALIDKLDAEQDRKEKEKEKAKLEIENADQKAELETKLLQIQNDFDAEQDLKLQLAELDRDILLQNDELTANQRLLIQEQFNAKKRELDNQRKDSEEKTNEALIESRQQLLGAVSSIFGQLAGLAKEGSAAAKALALTEIGINTAVGFVNGLRIAQQAAAATGPAAAFAFPVFFASQIGAVLSAASKAKSILGKGSSVSAPSATAAASPGSADSVSAFGIPENNETSTADLIEGQSNPVLLVDSVTKMQEDSAQVQAISTVS